VLINQAKDRMSSPMGEALHKIQGEAIKSRVVLLSADTPAKPQEL
jgi:hypothetical protein